MFLACPWAWHARHAHLTVPNPCAHTPGPAAFGGGSRGGSELTAATGDATDTAHTRGSTPGPSNSQGAASDGGPLDGRRGALKPKSKDDVGQIISKLGSQRINNIFTHLRKICQHPLLVRHHFTDDKVGGWGLVVGVGVEMAQLLRVGVLARAGL